MDLLTKFKQYIQEEKLFHPTNRLLLAVSGGVDSVALCELCRQAGYEFVMAHCNFKLRGSESDRDEEFVRELAQKYGVPLHVNTFDTITYAKDQKKSIEEAARELRYQWFHVLINEPGDASLQYILTGHHADDNMETVMMNFFRGTGISGLRGILPKQGSIVRPILFARRTELEQFALEYKLEFVTDHTNLQNNYTRNFFRNKVIPLVQESYPEAGNNLLKNIRRFRETAQLYQQSIALHKKKLLEFKGNEVLIPVLKLLHTTPIGSVMFEIIKPYGFTAHQTDEVINLLESETGKYVSSPSHRIIRNRRWLIITPLQTTAADNILIEAGDCVTEFAGGQLTMRQLPSDGYTISTGNHIAQFDSAAVKFPLLLRKLKQGDYFYPLGMQKKKKLNRFLTDRKLSLVEKENTWVMEMDKKIAWVVGQRIDDRFKVTAQTKNVLQVTYISK